MFENYSKCRIWNFQFWYFPQFYVNLDRFARYVECDFLGDFQSLWFCVSLCKYVLLKNWLFRKLFFMMKNMWGNRYWESLRIYVGVIFSIRHVDIKICILFQNSSNLFNFHVSLSLCRQQMPWQPMAKMR